MALLEDAAATWIDQARNLSPGLGNPLRAIENALNDNVVQSPWRLGQVDHVASDAELIIRGLGFRPLRESLEADQRERMRLMEQRLESRQRPFVRHLNDAIVAGDERAIERVLIDAEEAGVPFSVDQVRYRQRHTPTPRNEQQLQRLNRVVRDEAIQYQNLINRLVGEEPVE